MRKDIKNKIQFSAMVHPDYKAMLLECGELLGVPPNEALEVAIARLDAEKSKPNLSAKTSAQEIRTQLCDIRKEINQLTVLIEGLYDES